MRRVITIISIFLVTFTLLIEKPMYVRASEEGEPVAEVNIESRFVGVSIGCRYLHNCTFVITYNPDVLKIDTMRLYEGCYWDYDESQPGRMVFSFEEMFPPAQGVLFRYAGIVFDVIGCGFGDIAVESVTVTDSEKTYTVQPNIEDKSEEVVVHSIDYDNATNTLNLKDAKDNSFEGNEASVLDEYRMTTKKLVFEEGLTDLSCDCFSDFPTLEEVVIPSTFTSINEGAFRLAQESNENLHISGHSLSYAEQYATENGLKFAPVNEQLRGDISTDGEFEAGDALSILKMVVKLEPMYGYSADANEDGVVTAEDALYVLQKVVKLI